MQATVGGKVGKVGSWGVGCMAQREGEERERKEGEGGKEKGGRGSLRKERVSVEEGIRERER